MVFLLRATHKLYIISSEIYQQRSKQRVNYKRNASIVLCVGMKCENRLDLHSFKEFKTISLPLAS